jgi:hypothetical protein
MDKNYKKVDFVGNTIDNAVSRLQQYDNDGELVCSEFNGVILYSDTVTLDGAYKEITGKTYDEFKKAEQDWKDEYNRKEKEWQDNIADPIEQWKKKARGILSEDKWEYWDKIVPIRASDLYHGMELDACLDIAKILNNNGTLDEAKTMIESQNHSGMSFSLVRAMVREFCNRGVEFSEYVK